MRDEWLPWFDEANAFIDASVIVPARGVPLPAWHISTRWSEWLDGRGVERHRHDDGFHALLHLLKRRGAVQLRIDDDPHFRFVRLIDPVTDIE